MQTQHGANKLRSSAVAVLLGFLSLAGCKKTELQAPLVAVDPIERFAEGPLSDEPRFGELQMIDGAALFCGVRWLPDGTSDDAGRGGWLAQAFRADDAQLGAYRLLVSTPDPTWPSDGVFALIARVQKKESGQWRKFGPQKWWRVEGAVEELYFFSEDPPHFAHSSWEANGTKIFSEIMGGQHSPEILAFDRPIEAVGDRTEAQALADLEALLNAGEDRAARIRARWPFHLRTLKRIAVVPMSPAIETWYDLADDPGQWSTCGVLRRRAADQEMDDITILLGDLLHDLRVVDDPFEIAQALPAKTSGQSGPVEWRFVDRSDDTHWRLLLQFRLR